MSAVCFFFSIHEPFFLRRYSVFDLGQNSLYEDDERNYAHVHGMAQRCYLPAIDLLLRKIREFNGEFRFACHVSIPAIELFEQYEPDVLAGLKALADTKAVEFVAGAAHSLAFLYSRTEFLRQLKDYCALTEKLFNQNPRCFCSTELIYNNDFAAFLDAQNFKVMLAEGTDHILGWRSPNFLYKAESAEKMALLLRNAKLSQDISLNFRNRNWDQWPLTAPKYAEWCRASAQNTDIINLFLNFNVLGGVNDASTGIFGFMEDLPKELFARGISFMTPQDAAKTLTVQDTISVHHFISWDDAGGDLNSWLGNDMQKDAVHFLYSLADEVHALNDPVLTHDFRRLQTSDYLRWMSTKWFSNHLPTNSPYAKSQDAYTTYMNILADFEMRLDEAIEKKNLQEAKANANGLTENKKKNKQMVA
ncbi:MAG: glycoside hydrolase family 57 protein [Desulfovibrionaceae bacterium]|nr:glycoside hydrolase family 57 protein [Desulfovibrionaceae bacterium]